MNLRAIANRLTSGVNPNVVAQAQICTGYDTAATGKRTPRYATPVPVIAQFQALSKKEIEHLDAIGVAGTETAAYVDMQLSSIDRPGQTGGDMLLLGTDAATPQSLRGTKWWVTAVLEGWATSGWCKVGLTRQMPS